MIIPKNVGCEMCGGRVKRSNYQRQKRFCSDKCRRAAETFRKLKVKKQ